MKELKFIITISQVEDEVRDEPNWRNTRNKTVLASLIRTRYTTIKRRIKVNRKYHNLPICTKEEFINWAMASKDLLNLFNKWIESGHQNRLIPTVDRINPKGGYTLGNMEWVALHTNARRARKKCG